MRSTPDRPQEMSVNLQVRVRIAPQGEYLYSYSLAPAPDRAETTSQPFAYESVPLESSVLARGLSMPVEI